MSGVRWAAGGPFAIVPEWILHVEIEVEVRRENGKVQERRLIGDRAIRLFALLARYADKNGKSTPSKRRLAGQLGCSVSTLDVAVQELKAAGAVTVTARNRPSGEGQTTNEYLLHVDPKVKAPPSDSSGGTPSELSDAKNESQFEREEVSANALPSIRDPAKPPRLVKVEGRNLGWDALKDACEIRDGSNREGEVSAALNGSAAKGIPRGIRQLAWLEVVQAHFEGDADAAAVSVAEEPERFERAVEALIRRRSEQYREKVLHGGGPITGPGLAKWWLDLEHLTSSASGERRGLTPEEIERVADAEVARIEAGR